MTATVINCNLRDKRIPFYQLRVFLERNVYMDELPGDVLTIEELAIYLKISKSSLYKIVREGKIPSQKVGRHWRFRKKAIDRSLEETRPTTASSGEDD